MKEADPHVREYDDARHRARPDRVDDCRSVPIRLLLLAQRPPPAGALRPPELPDSRQGPLHFGKGRARDETVLVLERQRGETVLTKRLRGRRYFREI